MKKIQMKLKNSTRNHMLVVTTVGKQSSSMDSVVKGNCLELQSDREKFGLTALRPGWIQSCYAASGTQSS